MGSSAVRLDAFMRGASNPQIRPLLVGRAISGGVAALAAPALCRAARISADEGAARRIGAAVAVADALSVVAGSLASGRSLVVAGRVNAASDAAGAAALILLARTRSGGPRLLLLVLAAGLAAGSAAWSRASSRL